MSENTTHRTHGQAPLTGAPAPATIRAAVKKQPLYIMNNSSIRMFRQMVVAVALTAALVSACAPPQPDTPRPTAGIILQITPAPTQNIDATATVYAGRLIPTPTPAGLYVVQAGDTLGGLAEGFGTTVEELLAANGLTDPNAIQAGQTLLIPSLISGTLPLATAATAETISSLDDTAAPTEAPTAAEEATEEAGAPAPSVTPTLTSP